MNNLQGNWKTTDKKSISTTRSIVEFLILFPAYFLYSKVICSPFVLGDQILYRSFYSKIETVEFSRVAEIAREIIRAEEPISLFAIWIGSRLGIDKDIYMSFVNALLLHGIFLTVKKYKGGKITFLLLIFNFYTTVLLTSAERLKFGYILLTWATVFGRAGTPLLIAAPLAHLQNILLVMSATLIAQKESLFRLLFQGKFSYRFFLKIVGFSVLCFTLATVFQTQITSKIAFYTAAPNDGVSDTIRGLSLIFFSMFAIKQRSKLIIAVTPIILISPWLSGGRINMIITTILIYFFLTERKMKTLIPISICLYFVFKNLLFVRYIFLYGNGFAGFID